MTSALAPLEIRRFRALWVAAMVSNLGSFFQSVAGSWLMFELTGSAAWVGLMVASNLLPLLFLALASGAAADLLDRTKVMLTSQILMGSAAAAMAVFTALDLISPELLLGLGLVLGVGVAFNLPAWQALVPDLVPRGMVASAVALNSVAFNVARAVGPALGGAVVATAGPAVAFGLNAVSYLGVIVVVAVIGRRLRVRADADTTSISTAIALGVRFARFTRPFRMLLLLGALFATTSAVVQAVLPVRTDELDGSAAAYGLLLGSMGVGALAGAFTRPWVVDRLGPVSVPTTISLFGLAGAALGLAPSLPVAAVALVVAGAAWVWTLTTLNATAQLMAPAWLRGRAMSLWTLAFSGVFPLGAALGGVVADAIGAGAAQVVLSVGAIGVGLAARGFGIPALGDVVTPEYSEDRPPPAHVETEGGPVMIVNTWEVPRERLDDFLHLMAEVKLVRMRTGAYRWRLYRNAENPRRLSEVFLCVSWDEHLAQHRRIDDDSAALLRAARALDARGEPESRHLVAVDVEHPEDWEPLMLAHRQYHQTDGSIPLRAPGSVRTTGRSP